MVISNQYEAVQHDSFLLQCHCSPSSRVYHSSPAGYQLTMQGADRCRVQEPEASTHRGLISLLCCFFFFFTWSDAWVNENTHTHTDGNKKKLTLTFIWPSPLLWMCAVDIPSKAWLVCKRFSNSPPSTRDKPPGQKILNGAPLTSWTGAFFSHSIHKDDSRVNSTDFPARLTATTPDHSSSDEGSPRVLVHPRQVSASGSAGEAQWCLQPCSALLCPACRWA